MRGGEPISFPDFMIGSPETGVDGEPRTGGICFEGEHEPAKERELRISCDIRDSKRYLNLQTRGVTAGSARCAIVLLPGCGDGVGAEHCFPALNFMHFVTCSSSDVIARKRAQWHLARAITVGLGRAPVGY